jgi:hypothetical protein
MQQLQSPATILEPAWVILLAFPAIRRLDFLPRDLDENRSRPLALVRIVEVVHDNQPFPERHVANGTDIPLQSLELRFHEGAAANLLLESLNRIEFA